MTNHKHTPAQQSLSAQHQAEQEMLAAVLSTETPYPWLPATASDYFADAATIGEDLALSDEEATFGWQAMSAQLNTLWAEPSIQVALSQRFAQRLSQAMIEHITAKASQLASTGRPLAEQLISCVRDTLTGWDDTDLQVMARPLAHAMRGQEEILEATINSVRDVEWTMLSPMEQARISLAAARWAIDYAKAQDTHQSSLQEDA